MGSRGLPQYLPPPRAPTSRAPLLLSPTCSCSGEAKLCVKASQDTSFSQILPEVWSPVPCSRLPGMFARFCSRLLCASVAGFLPSAQLFLLPQGCWAH